MLPMGSERLVRYLEELSLLWMGAPSLPTAASPLKHLLSSMRFDQDAPRDRQHLGERDCRRVGHRAMPPGATRSAVGAPGGSLGQPARSDPLPPLST